MLFRLASAERQMEMEDMAGEKMEELSKLLGY